MRVLWEHDGMDCRALARAHETVRAGSGWEHRTTVRRYSAPSGGGIVRREDGSELCEGLRLTGDVLRWDPALHGPLAYLLRTQWRRSQARRRAERRAGIMERLP